MSLENNIVTTPNTVLQNHQAEGYPVEQWIEENQEWVKGNALTTQLIHGLAQLANLDEIKEADSFSHHSSLRPLVPENTDDPSHWSSWE